MLRGWNLGLPLFLRFPEPLEKGANRYYGYRPAERGKLRSKLHRCVRRQKKVAKIIEKLIKAVTEIIKNQDAANIILLRGFSQAPDIPHFEEVYGLKSGCNRNLSDVQGGLQNLSAWTPLMITGRRKRRDRFSEAEL